MNKAVKASGLTVTCGKREVLHNIALEVPSGTVTGLLGPSGCGKSTLMRAIVGSQAKVTGDLHVLGEPAGSRALRHRVGYATQGASVYEDLTVQENLRYFAGVLGAPTSDVDRVLRSVGLQGVANTRVESLSGGQRNRVSLGTALLGPPELLVLDEPTVGLDPVLREELWSLFRTLAEGGVTLLVSSHVMDEALRCESLVLMREGRVLMQTTPETCLPAPAPPTPRRHSWRSSRTRRIGHEHSDDSPQNARDSRTGAQAIQPRSEVRRSAAVGSELVYRTICEAV